MRALDAGAFSDTELSPVLRLAVMERVAARVIEWCVGASSVDGLAPRTRFIGIVQAPHGADPAQLAGTPSDLDALFTSSQTDSVETMVYDFLVSRKRASHVPDIDVAAAFVVEAVPVWRARRDALAAGASTGAWFGGRVGDGEPCLRFSVAFADGARAMFTVDSFGRTGPVVASDPVATAWHSPGDPDEWFGHVRTSCPQAARLMRYSGMEQSEVALL